MADRPALSLDEALELRLDSPPYDDSHRAWQESLRRFLEAEIAPHATEWDEAGAVPAEAHRACAAFGLTGLGYPEAYGGWSDGVDILHHVITSLEWGRLGAGGVTTALSTHAIGLPPLLAGGSDALKARVVPGVISGEAIIGLAVTEPGAGSDVAGLATRAEAVDDGFVVNGEKTYISGGLRADYLTVAVRTGDAGAGGISLLLMDMRAPGVSRTELPKQGWWASDTASIHFDGARVPADHLIGPLHGGFPLIMRNFNIERLSMSAIAIGASRRCLADALAWARERRTFGRRLADHQVIRHQLMDMYRQIAAAQAWLEQVAGRLRDGAPVAADIALLKVQASQLMEFCAREASQILGGASYIRGTAVERIYREVRVVAIGGGSEEILKDLAARQAGI